MFVLSLFLLNLSSLQMNIHFHHINLQTIFLMISYQEEPLSLRANAIFKCQIKDLNLGASQPWACTDKQFCVSCQIERNMTVLTVFFWLWIQRKTARFIIERKTVSTVRWKITYRISWRHALIRSRLLILVASTGIGLYLSLFN